jgi:hypothetical protein
MIERLLGVVGPRRTSWRRAAVLQPRPRSLRHAAGRPMVCRSHLSAVAALRLPGARRHRSRCGSVLGTRGAAHADQSTRSRT